MITISDVKIETTPHPVGILCSGGADSAILLYILLKHTTVPITVFTLGNKEKNYLNIEIAKKVIETCQQLTGMNIKSHVIRKCQEQTKHEVFNHEFLNYADNGTIKYIYTGFTANPPKSVTDTFIDSTDLSIRDPLTIHPYWHRNNTVYTPFANIDKSKIAEMYSYLDVMDTLYPVTRSCEWHSGMGDDDPGIGHCGRCWWCEERLWAFKKIS